MNRKIKIDLDRLKTYIVEIEIDEYNDVNPRVDIDGHLTIFALFHKKYLLPNDTDINSKEHGSWEEIEEQLHKDYPDIVAISRVYMYEHSGIGLSTSNARYPFNCRWDSGTVGFVFITQERIDEFKATLTEEECYSLISNDVEEYSHYVSGNVYRFEINEKVYCQCCAQFRHDHIDSCSGFYGYNIEDNGMLEHILPNFPEEMREEVKSKLLNL
jgi:hypothetical protein